MNSVQFTSQPTQQSDHGPVRRRRARAGFVRRRGLDLVINLVLIAALWLAYTWCRRITADDMSAAFGHASSLLDFQSTLGLPSELRFQHFFLRYEGVLRAANVYYVAIHFPATIALLAYAWVRHRAQFGRIRNALAIVTAAALVIHASYPLAPPRMINGFVDTAVVYGPNPYAMEVSSSANQIAAMPSLHVGWSLIVALAIIAIARSRWRYVAVVHPVITTLVVVVTANHYWMDAFVAVALVAACWPLTAIALARARDDRSARLVAEPELGAVGDDRAVLDEHVHLDHLSNA